MAETDRQSKLRKRVVIIMFPPGTDTNAVPLHPFIRLKGQAKTPGRSITDLLETSLCPSRAVSMNRR